jgi:tRNA-dihydrouridine synthase A
MRAAVAVPVTVKCRIGVDDSEEFDFLASFVGTVAEAGCSTFVVHARKAWLKGLSPKENRELPPLRHEVVHLLKREFPDLMIVLNGGLREPADAAAHLAYVDGIMVGREAYENPWSLTAFAREVLGTRAEPPPRGVVVEAMAAYAARHEGVPLKAVTRPMLGLDNGLPGARAFRRRLSAVGPGDGPATLLEAASLVRAPGRTPAAA